MERDVRPEADVYGSGDHLPDHPHQPNEPVFTFPSWEENHGGPGQLRRNSTLSEIQLHHTYQSSPS